MEVKVPCYRRFLAKGVRWYYKFDINGITYHSKCIYLTKAEAKQAEANARMKEDKADRITSTISLHDAIIDRLRYLKQVRSEKYYNDSKRYLDDFHNSVNYNISVSDINNWHIETFLMGLSDRLTISKKKNYAVNAAIRCLKSFFNFAIQKNMLDMKNPVMSKFFPIEKRLKYIPTDAEIEAVLKLCDPEQRLLIEFVRDTGARISEALNLKYSDIHENYIVLYTRKSKNSDLTPRKVPLNFSLPANIPPDFLVFGRWTEQPRFIEKKLKKLKMKSWSWHSLRHRYASRLSKENRPLFEIMSLLGHSNLETTQRYLQLLP